MLIGLVGDLHIGARGGNPDVRNFIKSYFSEYLFPKFKELGINTYIQAGDVFDVRKSIHGLDMDFILNDFIPLHEDYQIECHALTGNHDITLRDSNRISWVNVLARLSEGYIVGYQNPVTTTICGEKFCMLPWINSENYEETLQVIDASQAEYAIGHLELSGFPMYRNSISEEGQVELQTLSKFKKVLTGHFHTQSDSGNIQYLGTPYHLTWQDFPDGTNRGFHTLDTVTGEIKFYPNPENLSLFKVFVYSWKECDENPALMVSLKEPKCLEDLGLKGSIVKVIVEDRGNAKHYQDFCSALRRCQLIDYTIIDKTQTSSLESGTGGLEGEQTPVLTEAELETDIITVLKDRIKLNPDINQDITTEIITGVYNKALESGV